MSASVGGSWLDSKQKSGPRTAYFNLAGVAWQPARLRLRGNVGWSGAGTEIYAYLNYIDGVEDRSEEHTSELQSLMRISYAVFCLKKKQTTIIYHTPTLHRNKKQRRR